MAILFFMFFFQLFVKFSVHNEQYGLKELWTGKQCKSELVDKNVSLKWLEQKKRKF